jgi:hypothetical protein
MLRRVIRGTVSTQFEMCGTERCALIEVKFPAFAGGIRKSQKLEPTQTAPWPTFEAEQY